MNKNQETNTHFENSLSFDLIQDNLKSFAMKNDNMTSNTSDFDNIFKDGSLVEFIFGVCLDVSTPLEVRYVAVELMDRFMQKHIFDLWQTVHSSSNDKSLDWSAVESRIGEQIQLRAITCIQIASKLCNHYEALTARKVKKLLSNCDMLFSMSSIIRSEQRVLKTLDYKLMVLTPFDHIDILLQALGKNCPGINYEKVFDVATKILDIFYLRRSCIFEKVNLVCGVEVEKKSENDYLYWAAAIIASSGYLIDVESSDKLIEQIALIICCDESELVLLATTLIYVVLNKHEQ